MTLKMTTLQRCLNFLDCRRIRYTHTTYSPAYTAREVAAKECLPLRSIAKAVVLLGDGYVIAVVPADKQVSVAQMRPATGIDHLQVASEAELLQLFPNSD